MEKTNVVLIPVDYLNSRKVCESIEGNIYNTRSELHNELDRLLTKEDEDEVVDSIYIMTLTDFMDAVNNQELDVMVNYFISYVKINEK